MANVNTQTGKIIGTPNNSLVWWHEKGHIEFAQSDYGQRWHYIQSVLFILLITSLSLSFYIDFFRLVNLLLVGSYLLIDCYEEIWSWAYAYIKLRYKK